MIIVNGIRKIKILLDAIKFEHTVFALPFAYLGLVLAEDGWPRFPIFFWVTMAMVGLRTAGMFFNRIFDQHYDKMNPRTKNRALPAGLLTQKTAWTAAFIGSFFYFLSAGILNSLCLKLALIPFALALAYPFLKRRTYLCHFGVGIVLAGAPIGGWVASRGTCMGAPYLISAAVLFWVAGFDILYSLQDIESDRKVGLHSIPACFGEKKALMTAALFHAAMFGSLVMFGYAAHLGFIYFLGMLLIGFFLCRQHFLVFQYGLVRVNEAFFTLNAFVSVAMFVFTFLDLLVS